MKIAQSLRSNGRHYVLKAKSSKSFFHNIYPRRIADFRNRFGDEFSIIVWNDDDFYAIPFLILKPLLIPVNLLIDRIDRLRWLINICDGQYVISRGNGKPTIRKDVREYLNQPPSICIPVTNGQILVSEFLTHITITYGTHRILLGKET